MQRLSILVAVVLVSAACAGGTDDTEPTIPPTAAPTAPPATSPTATSEPPPETFELLAVGGQELVVHPGGRSLSPGLGGQLGTAFDDLAGGVVFSRVDGDGGVWHLPAGRDNPTLLAQGEAGNVPELLDVTSPPNRPPTALVRTGRALQLIPLTGGAPGSLELSQLATDAAALFGTASLGGDRLMVAWIEEGCMSVNLHELDGTLAVEGLFEACDSDLPVMSDEGDVIVTVERGASTRVVVRSTSDGLERSRWQIPAALGQPHVSGGQVAVGGGIGTVYTVTYGGDVATIEISPAGDWRSVTFARSVIDISDLATLGGIALLTNCSSDTRPPLLVLDGLTTDAAITRTAIANAAIECDVARLASFASTSFFGPSDDPIDYWLTREGAGFPVLLELVDLLATPYATVESEDGTLVYVWPAAAVEGDAASWEALRALYNEEDIDRWESGAEPYDRLVVRITETGDWIQASSDF